MNFFPDFAPNSRKEWRLLLFQSNLRKQIRKLPKFLKFVRIIHYYSTLFTGVLIRGTPNWSAATKRSMAWPPSSDHFIQSSLWKTKYRRNNLLIIWTHYRAMILSILDASRRNGGNLRFNPKVICLGRVEAWPFPAWSPSHRYRETRAPRGTPRFKVDYSRMISICDEKQ